MPTTRQVQAIATVNTCVNNRIYAFFQHKGCGCKCKGDCVHKQMFYYLIMDALNSPYIDELTQEQINCMIAHAECGSKFPPPPTPGACLSCDYSLDFSLASQTCDYSFTFNLKTSEIVSYTLNGVTTTINEVIATDMDALLLLLQILDPAFTGYTLSGSNAIFYLADTSDIYSFTTTIGGLEAPDVVGVASSCTSAFPFWIYDFNGDTVNEQVADYTELQDFLLTLGFSPTIPGIITSCVYTYSFTAPFGGAFGYDIVITINGVQQTAIPIANQTDLDNFFIGYGFTKISNTYYTHPTTSDVYGDVTFSLAGDLVCTSPPQSLIPLEVSIYDTTAFIDPSLPFTGISIDIGGTLYSDAATYTTVQQMMEWMNSLVSFQGYFYYDIPANQIVVRTNSYSAPIFGNITTDTAGTPQITVVSTTTISPNCWKFNCAAVVFPITSGGIIIDGINYALPPLANIAALVTYINSQPGGVVNLGYASATGTDIYLQHRRSTMSASVTFPTTLFEVNVQAVTYTAPGAINDAYEAAQYLNTLGLGEFSTDGTFVYFMPYNNQVWLNTTDDSGTWNSSNNTLTGELRPIVNLYACTGTAGGNETISPYVSNCVSDYIFSILDTCDSYSGTVSIGTVDVTSIASAGATYTIWDLSSATFPNAFRIVVDAVTTDLYAVDINSLLTQLNALATGVFILDGTQLIVKNTNTFSDLYSNHVNYTGVSTAKFPNYVTIGVNSIDRFLGNPLGVNGIEAPFNALALGVSDVTDNGATFDMVIYGWESYGNISIGTFQWDITSLVYPSIGTNVLIDAVLTNLGAMADEAALVAAMTALNIGTLDFNGGTHVITISSSHLFGRIQSTSGSPPLVLNQIINLKTAPPTQAGILTTFETFAATQFAPTPIGFVQSNCHEKFPS